MIKQLVSTALLAIAAASSSAAELTPFFVGADVGSTKFDGVSGKTTSYGVCGGYQLNRYAAAELSFRRLGNVYLYSPTTVSHGELDQTVLSVIGTLPLDNGFGLIARYGRARISHDGKNIDSEYNSGALFGVGAEYSWTPAMGVRLELQKPSSGVANLSAGLIFKF